MRRFLVPTLLTVLSLTSSAFAQDKQVTLVKTPGRGIQPQVVVDAKGSLHLLYYVGEPGGGNLMYVKKGAGQTAFSTPIRVNSQEGSAVATGTIRGGQLAIGKNGRPHVAWNGSMKAMPQNPIKGMPMLYARLDEKGTAFEPQRNLMTASQVLDGGGSLMADSQGNVVVVWQAQGRELIPGEDNRRVYVAVSHNDGRTFAAEKPAWTENTGACGCCGIRGFVDSKDNAYFLYRAATQKTNRGMYLLRSGDGGESFAGKALDNWEIMTCPMSSEAFAEGPAGVYLAWDNDGQIFFTHTPTASLSAGTPTAAPGDGKSRKHPSLAVNKRGEMLLAWTEGTGWNRGGALVWQVYDAKGQPTAERGRRDGAIAVWGLPAAVAEPDGKFTIYH
jgi:hypothetical protein